MVCNPQAMQTYIQLWCGTEVAIPQTGMVGTMVSEGREAAHPTLQHFMLRQVETVGYLFLHFLVREVIVEFGKSKKRCSLS